MMPGSVSYPPLLCTFHKFGLLFLKFHIEKLGRNNNFVIIDSDDKKRLIRNIAKELKIDLSISFIAVITSYSIHYTKLYELKMNRIC